MFFQNKERPVCPLDPFDVNGAFLTSIGVMFFAMGLAVEPIVPVIFRDMDCLMLPVSLDVFLVNNKHR